MRMAAVPDIEAPGAFRLNGTKMFVVDGHIAQLLLVVAAGVWLVASVAQTAAAGLRDVPSAVAFGGSGHRDHSSRSGVRRRAILKHRVRDRSGGQSAAGCDPTG